MNKNWKNVERRIARKFGTERTPLSGGNSRHTRSDSLHKDIYMEQKYSKRFAFHNLFRKTAELAKLENKIPCLITTEKYKRYSLVTCKLEEITVIAIAYEEGDLKVAEDD